MAMNVPAAPMQSAPQQGQVIQGNFQPQPQMTMPGVPTEIPMSENPIFTIPGLQQQPLGVTGVPPVINPQQQYQLPQIPQQQMQMLDPTQFQQQYIQPQAQPQGLPQLPHGFSDWNQVVAAVQGIQAQPQQDIQAKLQAMEQYNNDISEKFTTLLDRLANGQPKTNEGPDYLAMGQDELLSLMNGDPENGKSGNIKAILESVRQKSVNEATSTLSKEISGLKQQLNSIVGQHTQLQATYQVQRLKNQYGQTDPQFEQHLQEAGKWLVSDAGKSVVQNTDNPLELAYKLQLAQRLTDPLFQQQMAQQAMQLQQAQLLQKMTGVAPATTQQPNQMMQPMVQQAQQPDGAVSDMSVLAKVLSFGPSLGYPNVAMV